MMQCTILDEHEYGFSSDLTTTCGTQHTFTELKAYSNIDTVSQSCVMSAILPCTALFVVTSYGWDHVLYDYYAKIGTSQKSRTRDFFRAQICAP